MSETLELNYLYKAKVVDVYDGANLNQLLLDQGLAREYKK